MEVQRRNGDAESGGVHCCHTKDCEAEVLRVEQGVRVKSLVILGWQVVFDVFGNMANCAEERYGLGLKPAL